MKPNKKTNRMSKKEKKVEYFTDKYGIITVKTPISENDFALMEKIKDSLQAKIGRINNKPTEN